MANNCQQGVMTATSLGETGFYAIQEGIDTGIDTATAETVTELHQRIVLLEQKLAAATARNQKQLQAILAAVGEAE